MTSPPKTPPGTPERKKYMNPRKIPFKIRQKIVEYLGPTEGQLEELEDLEETMELYDPKNSAVSRRWQRMVGYKDLADRADRKFEEARRDYMEYRKKIYEAPGIWETYKFFWEDKLNFFPKPDDDPSPEGGPPGGGGAGIAGGVPIQQPIFG